MSISDMSSEAFWSVIDDFENKSKFDSVLRMLARVCRDDWTPMMMALYLCKDFSDNEGRGDTFKLSLNCLGREMSKQGDGVKFTLKSWDELDEVRDQGNERYEIGAKNYQAINISLSYKNTEAICISISKEPNNEGITVYREISFVDLEKWMKIDNGAFLNEYIFSAITELLDIK